MTDRLTLLGRQNLKLAVSSHSWLLAAWKSSIQVRKSCVWAVHTCVWTHMNNVSHPTTHTHTPHATVVICYAPGGMLTKWLISLCCLRLWTPPFPLQQCQRATNTHSSKHGHPEKATGTFICALACPRLHPTNSRLTLSKTHFWPALTCTRNTFERRTILNRPKIQFHQISELDININIFWFIVNKMEVLPGTSDREETPGAEPEPTRGIIDPMEELEKIGRVESGLLCTTQIWISGRKWMDWYIKGV